MPRRFLIAAMVMAAGAAAAQQPSLKDAQAEQRRQEQRRDSSAREAADVREEIRGLTRELSQLTIAQSRDGDDILAERRRLEGLNEREQALTAALGGEQARLARLLGALQTYGKHPPPALLVHPDDAKDAVRAAILMRAVLPDLKGRADTLSAELAEIQTVRRDVAAANEGLFLSESEFAERAAEIERLIEERQALEAHLMAEVAEAESDLTVLSARIQNLRLGGATAPPAAPALTLPDRLTAPVSGSPTRRFGQAARGGGRVEGWVWEPRPGSDVVSPADGRVEYAGPLSGYNNVLILAIGGDYLLVIAGVDELAVAAGEMVDSGQTLAKIPANGENETAELYIEVRRGGEPVDPARFFAAIR